MSSSWRLCSSAGVTAGYTIVWCHSGSLVRLRKRVRRSFSASRPAGQTTQQKTEIVAQPPPLDGVDNSDHFSGFLIFQNIKTIITKQTKQIFTWKENAADERIGPGVPVGPPRLQLAGPQDRYVQNVGPTVVTRKQLHLTQRKRPLPIHNKMNQFKNQIKPER